MKRQESEVRSGDYSLTSIKAFHAYQVVMQAAFVFPTIHVFCRGHLMVFYRKIFESGSIEHDITQWAKIEMVMEYQPVAIALALPVNRLINPIPTTDDKGFSYSDSTLPMARKPTYGHGCACVRCY